MRVEIRTEKEEAPESKFDLGQIGRGLFLQYATVSFVTYVEVEVGNLIPSVPEFFEGDMISLIRREGINRRSKILGLLSLILHCFCRSRAFVSCSDRKDYNPSLAVNSVRMLTQLV